MFIAIVILLALAMHAIYCYGISRNIFPVFKSRFAWVIIIYTWQHFIRDPEWRHSATMASTGLVMISTYSIFVVLLAAIMNVPKFNILAGMIYPAYFFSLMIPALYRRERKRQMA